MTAQPALQFAPLSSALEGGFWHQLSELKLNVYGLDDKPRDITGFYVNGDADGLPSRTTLSYNAFEDCVVPPRSYRSHGFLKNTNTLDEFKACDKKKILEEQAQMIWADICSGQALENSSLLSRFHLLTFADLKKYHYYYWFAFPALCFPENLSLPSPARKVDDIFSYDQMQNLLKRFDEVCLPENIGYFLVTEENNELNIRFLSDFENLHSKGKKIYLGFCDPCTLENHPGWPLRNLLALAALHWSTELQGRVSVLCLRDRFKDGKRSMSHSLILDVCFPPDNSITECPKCVGWEKNERQKLGPRTVNLSASMDPSRIAESAVDLNLKLMRWRLLPQLDLETISATKCLLLGAGTLGCNVARCLLGWGVRTITLVDYGKISYSNPVRQSLFTFEDSLKGGQPKAQTAAEALKKIFPGVNATGISLSIPMPGHTVTEDTKEQTQRDVEQLEALIEGHDAVFLLMDTRESRWLPTVIGASKRKIVINAALGFDTYLVVRHGVKKPAAVMETDSLLPTGSLPKVVSGDQLGCYFCNDVVAPGDSTRDRTLDQQCTVSRPGMSLMASALAVELLISLITHPDRGHAVADTSANDEHLTKDFHSPLGLIPHQIRGFLSRFHSMMPACVAFDKCTACSPKILQAYEKEGFDFLMQSFNEPKYLEDLCGLTSLHKETLEDDVWELTDDEDV